MLRDFLTPEAFEIGIIRYLKRYSYQNTVNSHLWESLTNVSEVVEGYITMVDVTLTLELKTSVVIVRHIQVFVEGMTHHMGPSVFGI